MEKLSNNQEWFNSKCYTASGNRVAVFGVKLTDNIIGIFELECSRKDMFNKSTARIIFDIYRTQGINAVSFLGYKPRVKRIQALSEDSLEHTFFKYCKDNFYKLVTKRLPVYQDSTYLISSQGKKKIVKNAIVNKFL